MQAQRIWDAEIKASQRDALDTLHQLKESAINTLRGSNDQASSIIGELAKQLQLSKESSNILSDELKKVCIKELEICYANVHPLISQYKLSQNQRPRSS